MVGSDKFIRTESSAGVVYNKPVTKKRSDAQIEEFKKEYSTDAHRIPLNDLERRLSTSAIVGIPQTQANELLLAHGPNCLVASATKSRWIIFIEFIFGGFASLLWAAAILCLVNYYVSKLLQPEAKPPEDQLCLAIVLIIVNVVTGTFGYYQESANVAILETFKKLVPKYALVIRDGSKKSIPSEEIVVGDLVVVNAGECIPADIRLIEVTQLKVDNSSITGESHPQARSTTCTNDDPMETANVAFYSTSVIEGSGRGIVFNTGENTLIGKIAGLTTSLEKGETPIHKEIKYFIKLISVIATLVGSIFFITSLVSGYGFFDSFGFFIAILIGHVPEGLLVTLVASWTLTAKRMAKKNCLIKKMEAIETLGCCNVICSDKTGTLTQNKMTVAHLYFNLQTHYVLNMPSLMVFQDDDNSFHELCKVAMLCSRATYAPDQDYVHISNRKILGDASEAAILKLMTHWFHDVESFRKKYPKIFEIPFNSTNKYQVSIHTNQNGGGYLLVIKGAPERIIEFCSTLKMQDEEIPLASSTLRRVNDAVLNFAHKGERVLAFADCVLPRSYQPPNAATELNLPLKGFRLIGLVSMVDPPRPSVPEAIATCQTAGIRVIMVTGDHPITAQSIAKQIGIISPNSKTTYDLAQKKGSSGNLATAGGPSHTGAMQAYATAGVFTGSDLRHMTQHDLQNQLLNYQEIIFARTSPQQKLKIVEALQGLGMIVAVTGDGVNDSPALKKADIGIAMGIVGSDVSKEAADMILLDDNFASIVLGIEEGRVIFDNLKKSVAYLLTSNLPEVLPFVFMIVFNIPRALDTLAIILIDVGTDLWPAISLVYEKAEADIMKRPPRNPYYDTLVNHRIIFLTYGQIGVIQTVASYTSYFYLMAEHGFFYSMLPGIRSKWESPQGNITNYYGQNFDFETRENLRHECNAAYFLCIIVTQISDLLICKTRRLSIFEQGMSNWVLNAGIVFEIIVGCIVVYTPGLNNLLYFEPVPIIPILCSLPFGLFIVVYDEFRRYMIRKRPGGFFDRETYY